MNGRASKAARSAALGHTGSSFSAIASDLSHQASRQRRHELRAKLRRFARRDIVERTKWVKVFEADARNGVFEDTWGEEVRREPRDDRYLACGQRRRAGMNHVGVRSSDGARAGFSNLQSCGSVWSCPVCAGKIMRQRADELGKALRWARREGHTVAMITLTVRHHRDDSLRDVWDAVAHGWNKVTSGRAWAGESEEEYADWLADWAPKWHAALRGDRRMHHTWRNLVVPRARRIGDQERFGVLGWARAAEVKHGANGWHVHLHVVAVLERDGDGAEATYNGEVAAIRLGHEMWKRWDAAMPAEHKGTEDHGVNVSVNGAAEKTLAEYLSKDGLDDDRETIERSIDAKGRAVAMEVTHGASKEHMKNKHAGVTPFQLLDRIDPGVQTDGAFRRDLALWYEWVDGSEGRRQLTWSAGFRALVGLAETELTDAEIADQEDGGEVVLTLPPETWEEVRHESWRLLEVVEAEGVAALKRFLDRFEWFDPHSGEMYVGLEYGEPVRDNVEIQEAWAL